jgi:predicted anti-sigma-YlaC factor YlaD
MKCEDASKKLIGYLDRRAHSAERREVEDHLVVCAACRRRAEEFGRLWSVLDQVPVLETSPGFDARLRQRVAQEPPATWFDWLMPQPRLVFSMALLVALSVWMARVPQDNSGVYGTTAQTEQEDFNAIKDLGVLENYEVVTKFDALSELLPSSEQQPEPQRVKRTSND